MGTQNTVRGRAVARIAQGFQRILMQGILLPMVAIIPAMAQPPAFPPVPGNDVQRRDFGLWSNPGWVVDNEGDLRPDVQYVTDGASPRTYIRKNATLSFTATSVDTGSGGVDTLRRLDMHLQGELALHPDAIGSSARSEWHNYYLPHCGPLGVTHVVGYNRIVYPNIYPDIDLWVFSGYYGQKMMFVVHPGGSPANIVMKFTGQDEMDVDLNGWLNLLLENKWIKLPEAIAYQYDQNNVITPMLWGADYLADGNSGTASFHFDAYDATKPLVFLIGPPPPMGGSPFYDEVGLCWSTYLGDDGFDYAEDIRLDNDQNLYVTGRTSSTILQFPANPGVVHATSGNTVAFMTKFDAQHLLNWTLFYGGDVLTSTTNGQAIAVRETPTRRIYLAGITTAEDLWTHPNGGAYFDGTNASTTNKGFVIDVDDQFGQAQWATYFGEHDVEIHGMDVGPNNNLVICGTAKSDLPDVQYAPPPGSLNQAYAGDQDAFIAMVDPNDQLFWRSWWGGPAADLAYNVRMNSNKIVMAGYTTSGNLTMVDPGNNAYEQTFGGNQDVFVFEFDLNGVPKWSAYLGGPGGDQLGPKGLDITHGGDVLICGKADNGFPMVHGPNWYDDIGNGGNGFIARFSGVDRSPLWITYAGGSTSMLLWAIKQGYDGHIHATGYTNDDLFPHAVVSGTYDQGSSYETSYGSFLLDFTENQQLYHSTWFGGDGGTEATAARALTSNADGVYITGFTHKTSDPAAYFPLDDGQGIPWFDGEYNHLGQSVLGTDGFVTLFCQEINVGFDAPPPAPDAGAIAVVDAEHLQILGLEDGLAPYDIHDASGRILLTGQVRSSIGRSNTIDIAHLAAGAYLVRCSPARPLKFIVR